MSTQLVEVSNLTTKGVRPGVKREDMWSFMRRSAYFVRCETHDEVSSIDPRFKACSSCGHSWRIDASTEPRPEDFAALAEYWHAHYEWRRQQNEACADAIPNRVCATCSSVAQRAGRPAPEPLPHHHLNVCHGCGAFVCFPHTYWHGEEDSETLCTSCRRAGAKDGTLPKGSTLHGEEKSV